MAERESYEDYLITLTTRKALVRTFDSIDAAMLVANIMEVGKNDRRNSRYVFDGDEETLAYQLGLSIPKLQEALKATEEVIEHTEEGYILYHIALVEAMAKVYPDLREEGDENE